MLIFYIVIYLWINNLTHNAPTVTDANLLLVAQSLLEKLRSRATKTSAAIAAAAAVADQRFLEHNNNNNKHHHHQTTSDSTKQRQHGQQQLQQLFGSTTSPPPSSSSSLKSSSSSLSLPMFSDKAIFGAPMIPVFEPINNNNYEGQQELVPEQEQQLEQQTSTSNNNNNVFLGNNGLGGGKINGHRGSRLVATVPLYLPEDWTQSSSIVGDGGDPVIMSGPDPPATSSSPPTFMELPFMASSSPSFTDHQDLTMVDGSALVEDPSMVSIDDTAGMESAPIFSLMWLNGRNQWPGFEFPFDESTNVFGGTDQQQQHEHEQNPESMEAAMDSNLLDPTYQKRFVMNSAKEILETSENRMILEKQQQQQQQQPLQPPLQQPFGQFFWPDNQNYLPTTTTIIAGGSNYYPLYGPGTYFFDDFQEKFFTNNNNNLGGIPIAPSWPSYDYLFEPSPLRLPPQPMATPSESIEFEWLANEQNQRQPAPVEPEPEPPITQQQPPPPPPVQINNNNNNSNWPHNSRYEAVNHDDDHDDGGSHGDSTKEKKKNVIVDEFATTTTGSNHNQTLSAKKEGQEEEQDVPFSIINKRSRAAKSGITIHDMNNDNGGEESNRNEERQGGPKSLEKEEQGDEGGEEEEAEEEDNVTGTGSEEEKNGGQKSLFQDKGHVKHGWKNVYHKEEWGEAQKYHDVWRYKDWKDKFYEQQQQEQQQKQQK